MYNHLYKPVLVGVMALTCGGCVAFSTNDVAQPSTLTVEQALGDVGAGFAAMKAHLKGQKTGLYACSVSLNLKVTANASMGGQLVVDISSSPSGGNISSAGAKLTQDNTSSALRDNTIDVKLYSPACLPKGTLGADKPGELISAIKALEAAGYTSYIIYGP